MWGKKKVIDIAVKYSGDNLEWIMIKRSDWDKMKADLNKSNIVFHTHYNVDPELYLMKGD